MSPDQTALEPRTKVPSVITTAAEYRAAMQKWQAENYNVLTPFTNVTGVAASFGIIASVVKIDTRAGSGEVYSGFAEDGRKAMPFLKGTKGQPDEEFALAKIGLRKVAECGGISTDAVRTDPRTIQYYWEFHATASYRGLDGSMITRSATFEWDLRDGSDRLKGWTANQITEGRKNGLRNCEARAINAAIRECGCGIKQKYTRAELDKPFLVIRVAFQPDMNDPDIKRMVTSQALTGASALYAPQQGHALAAPVDAGHDDPEPRQVGSGATAAAHQPAAADAAKPNPDLPPVEGAVKITKIETKTFTYKNGAKKGEQGTRYVIVDSNGAEHSTFSKSHTADAERFKAENAWVEFNEESDGQYTNLLEIMRAGSQPSLLPDASEL